jgi:hypothetical protein
MHPLLVRFRCDFDTIFYLFEDQFITEYVSKRSRATSWSNFMSYKTQ